MINRQEAKMRVVCGLLGAIALAGLALPAYAQAPPSGTYQQSCGDVRMQGSTLIAVCRDMNGRDVQTALNVANCVGDIGNSNGQLQCSGGQPPSAYSGQGYAPSYSGSGYPQGYGAAPGPGYQQPGYGYGPPPR
jgi:CVNH domain